MLSRKQRLRIEVLFGKRVLGLFLFFLFAVLEKYLKSEGGLVWQEGLLNKVQE
jgi:hypothetical protein